MNRRKLKVMAGFATPRRAAAVCLVGVALLATAACGANHADQPPETLDPLAADTARGVVAITGAEPLTQVTLRTGAGPIVLRGATTDTLRSAQGVEVWVAGTREQDGTLTVRSYRVREVNGLPAADGVLELDGATAVLVTSTGERIRYTPAPPGLRALAGRRVWIAGRVGEEPQSWGSLEPRS